MRILITCGPSYEPLDQVRRITNASTGRLGVTLANSLTKAGHEVVCCRGVGATFAETLRARECVEFGTNDELLRQLRDLAAAEAFDAVLHAAAVCDFRVERVDFPNAGETNHSKIASRGGPLRLILAPATKLLPLLRDLFPRARIVGWKYELDGTPTEALDKAWRQIREAHTDACVLNGSACGKGFAFCRPPDHVQRWEDLPALCRGLQNWLIQADDRTRSGGHHTGAPAVPRRPRRSRSPIRQDLHAHAR